MIEYNPKALIEFKKRYKLTYPDLMQITKLKGKASIYLRLNGEISLTAREIALLCNESIKLASKDQDKSTKVFTPTDFYTVY